MNWRTGGTLRRALLLATALMLALPAQSQPNRPDARTPEKAEKEQAKEPPKPEPPPPPYEERLLRLAEIMGALSYLQPLCAGDDANPADQTWREAMRSLLEAEAKTAKQRARLAGAYNTGLRGYEATYRTCTDNALVVIARFLAEGEKIARDVANRFGGG